MLCDSFLPVRLLSFAFWLIIVSTLSKAQQKIKLQDVAKIEFITRGHFMSPYYRRYTVNREGEKWQSYRTFLRDINGVDNQDTVYQSAIKAGDIKVLLRRAAGDTSISDYTKWFRISRAGIAKFIDSISVKENYPLTAKRRKHYIKLGASKVFNKSAADWLLHGLKIAGGYNYILLITANKDTVTFRGNDNGLYHSPWVVKNKKNYDRDIGIVFNKVSGNARDEYNKFYSNVYKALHLMVLTDILADKNNK